jgi:hypothetical protein
MKVCFTQSAIKNSTLDAAFKPQFDRFLETGFGLTHIAALRYDAYLRACRNATFRGITTHERLKIDLESYRFDHRGNLRCADAMPDVPRAQREPQGAIWNAGCGGAASPTYRRPVGAAIASNAKTWTSSNRGVA